MTATANTVPVIARVHPFKEDTVYAEAKAGQTIAEILGAQCRESVRVTVDGFPVPRSMWPHVRPKAGKQLHVTAFPEGGHSANKLLRLVVIIVAVVYAYYTQDYQGALAIASIGTGVVNMLVPPPIPKGAAQNDPFNPQVSVTGTSNRVNLFGPIPLVLGKPRFYPPHAALPYTEINGDQQYLRMLLDLGPGNLQIDPANIKIGETPISSYDGVEYQISTNPSLYTSDVYELNVGTALDTDGATDTRTTQQGATEISLDLDAPSGFFGFNSKNKAVNVSCTFAVTYRQTGTTGAWLSATAASGLTVANGSIAVSGNNFVVTSTTRDPLRTGIRFKVPAGQYDVVVTRVSTNWGTSVSQGQVGKFQWVNLRSFNPQSPSTTGTNKLAVRIKATDQLHGVISTLSVIAQQLISTYDSGTQTWTSNVATSNCAWVTYWLLNACPAIAKNVPASRLDLTAYADWAAQCTSKKFVFNQCLSSQMALFDLVKEIMSCGRASFGMREGKYTAVRDVSQTVPVQFFTPANSKNFSGQRDFRVAPHALRVKWTNPQANYQQDEIIVLDDGYTLNGKDAFGNASANPAATVFDKLDLTNVTDPDACWAIARYHLAATRLRLNTYTFETDIEHLRVDRGDLIRVTHDVPEWGVGWGRIKSMTEDPNNPGQYTAVDVDNVITFGSGSYQAQIRNDQCTAVVADLTTSAGTSNHLVFASNQTGIEVGDLVLIGLSGSVTQDLVVTRKQAISDLGARVTAVDAAPAVWTADSGTPPTFVSSITGQQFYEPPPDPDPNTTLFVSDQRNSFSNDGGLTDPRTHIRAPMAPGILRPDPGHGGPYRGARGFSPF